jgi:hypothetical protein
VWQSWSALVAAAIGSAFDSSTCKSSVLVLYVQYIHTCAKHPECCARSRRVLDACTQAPRRRVDLNLKWRAADSSSFPESVRVYRSIFIFARPLRGGLASLPCTKALASVAALTQVRPGSRHWQNTDICHVPGALLFPGLAPGLTGSCLLMPMERI